MIMFSHGSLLLLLTSRRSLLLISSHFSHIRLFYIFLFFFLCTLTLMDTNLDCFQLPDTNNTANNILLCALYEFK